MPLNRRNFLKAGCTLPLMSIAHKAAAADDTPIKVSTTPSIFESMFSQLTSDYNLTNPSRKALIREANRDQSAQLQATLRQALTHDLPDVSFQGFSYLATLKDQGILQPINEFVAAPELATLGIAGPVVDACRVGDDACGVAVGLSFPVFFVNATIAERAGFPRDALPGDWTGILDMARKIAALSADRALNRPNSRRRRRRGSPCTRARSPDGRMGVHEVLRQPAGPDHRRQEYRLRPSERHRA